MYSADRFLCADVVVVLGVLHERIFLTGGSSCVPLQKLRWNSAIKVHLHLCIFLCDVSFECLRGWWELMCAAPKVEMEQC